MPIYAVTHAFIARTGSASCALNSSVAFGFGKSSCSIYHHPSASPSTITSGIARPRKMHNHTNNPTSAASTLISFTGSAFCAVADFLPSTPLLPDPVSSAFIASFRAFKSTSFFGAPLGSRDLLSRDDRAAASAAADAAGGALGCEAPS